MIPVRNAMIGYVHDPPSWFMFIGINLIDDIFDRYHLSYLSPAKRKRNCFVLFQSKVFLKRIYLVDILGMK